MTPEFDVADGAVIEVIRKCISKLSDADRAAIAAYFKSRPVRAKN